MGRVDRADLLGREPRRPCGREVIENEGKAADRFARDLSLRSALNNHGFDATAR